MDTKISKSDRIKLTILTAILLVVLLFNGKIKGIVASWKTRLQQDRQTRSATFSDGPKGARASLSEISRIISEELSIPPLDQILKANQEWPDRVDRDIFKFQSSSSYRQQPAAATATRSDGPLKNHKQRNSEEPALSWPQPPRLKLEATLTGGTPMAVINDQPMMPGQSIMGYQLREVRDKEVVLSKNGRDIILTLDQEE